MITKKGNIELSTHEGYIAKIGIMSDVHVGYDSWGDYSKLKKVINTLNSKGLDFSMILGDCLDSGYSHTPELRDEQLAIFNECMKGLTHPLFKMRGNHDSGMSQFTDFGTITFNKFKFICIFPKYLVTNPPAGEASQYWGLGMLTETDIEWISNELKNSEGYIPIIFSHYCIHEYSSATGKNFTWPICDVISSTTTPSSLDGKTYDGHRRDLIALCRQYNVPLFVNGHEHRGNLINDTVDDLPMVNLQIGFTPREYVVLTVYNDRLFFEEFSSATNEPTGYTYELTLD